MSDCPHIHIQDSGLQAFRDIILEETDGGRDIVRFLKGAINREYSNYEPHHELKAAKTLVKYGSKEAELYVAANTAPKRRRTSGSSQSAPREPVQSEARPEHSRRAEGDRDPIMDPLKEEMARFIREETDNGRTIVRTLIHTMEAREDPYKPHHNLEAAKQLTDNGFPPTGDLLCAPDCSHHAPAHPEPIEGDGTSDSTNEEFVPDPGWVETLHEIKRMEDEGIIDKVEFDPFKPVYNWAPKEVVMPYADEVAAKFRAELDLQAERRAKWPEIEERRRKKLAQIYPSHSKDDDPPDT